MTLLNPSTLKFKEYDEVFGIAKEDVVTSNLIYRGWAPYEALTSEPKWRIQRESTVAGVTTIESVDNGDKDNVWDDRYSLFDEIPFSDNYAVLFDGINDYIDLGTNSVFAKERTDLFSIAFKYKPRTTSGTQYIYSKRATSILPGISINQTTTQLIFEIANSSTNRIHGRVSGIIAGTEYFVVMTYSGNSLLSGMKVYVNGVLQTLLNTVDTLGANSIATSTNAYFGQLAGASFYDGQLNEVSYWNKYVLSQAEVTEMWNDGDPYDLSLMSTYANCTCWWRCGDHSDDDYPVLKDVKGIANGAMTNMLASNFVEI